MNAIWQQFLRTTGATIGTHDGATACIGFPPATGEQLLADLSHQGVLAVRGPDAVKFLQGYLTCDVTQLSESPVAGALCNLQGRMVTNFHAFIQGDGVLLRMHRSLVARTRELLTKYVVFSKAKLIDESEHWQRIGVAGLDAERLVELARNAMPFSDSGTRSGSALLVLTLAASKRYELWLPINAAQRAWSALSEVAAPISVWRWEGLDIAEGRAWVSGTTSGQYLPQMFNLDALDAISFTKGCYLGQEIVTRAQHRGGVKRRLMRGRLEATAGQLANIGDAVYQGDHSVGELVAVGTTPATEALAVVSLASLKANTLDHPFSVGGLPFRLANLPYSVEA